MNERNDLIVLALLNAVIILSAEVVGGGTFFFRTGLIQVFAFFFIILAVARIGIVYRLHDPVLKKMLQGCLLAMLVFAESHVLSYFSGNVGLSEDAMLVNLVNLYVAGLLLLILGAQIVLRIKTPQRSAAIIVASTFILLFLSALTVIFALHDSIVTLDPAMPMPYVYGALVMLVGLLSAITMREARQAMRVLNEFWRRMIVGSTCIVVSALAVVFHFYLLEKFRLPPHQIAYIGYFTFYLGVSAMLLAFGSMRHMSGIYADLAKEREKPPLTS